MRINIRIIILASFVAILLIVLFARSCSNPPNKGEVVYNNQCASCHGTNGDGFRNLIPPLSDSTFLMGNQNSFACIVLNGLDSNILVGGNYYDNPMEGINLTPIQLTNLANYVYNRWGDPEKKFTLKEIENSIANCQ